MKVDNYYLLANKNYSKVASAFAPDNTKLAHELIPELINTNKLPFELNLVKLSIGKNGLIESNDLSGLDNIWLDLQPNTLAMPLMSEKLMKLIKDNLTGKEYLEWIFVTINKGDEKRNYYIPTFKKKLDVLDEKRTMYVKGTDHIIRPHFSLKKIKNISIFHKPDSGNLWKIPSGLYINERLQKEIVKQKLIGIEFEKIRVS